MDGDYIYFGHRASALINGGTGPSNTTTRKCEYILRSVASVVGGIMGDIATACMIAAKAAEERGQSSVAELIRSGQFSDTPAVQTAMSGAPIAASVDVNYDEPKAPSPANNPMIAVLNSGVWPGEIAPPAPPAKAAT